MELLIAHNAKKQHLAPKSVLPIQLSVNHVPLQDNVKMEIVKQDLILAMDVLLVYQKNIMAAIV